jgi:hypothetical protein
MLVKLKAITIPRIKKQFPNISEEELKEIQKYAWPTQYTLQAGVNYDR